MFSLMLIAFQWRDAQWSLSYGLLGFVFLMLGMLELHGLFLPYSTSLMWSTAACESVIGGPLGAVLSCCG